MARCRVRFYLQIMVLIIEPEIAGEFPNILQRKTIVLNVNELQLYVITLKKYSIIFFSLLESQL